MNNGQPNHCDFLLQYAVGEGTREERQSFERHLSSCTSCRTELDELKEIWESMPLLTEETEVPSDLKNEVMGHIFGETSMKPTRKWRARSVVAGAAAVLLLAVGVTLWSVNDKKQTAVTVNFQPPTNVLHTYALNSADAAMPSAKGTAWVVQGEEKNQVIVHLQGLEKSNGDEVYQVWLIHDGKRYNCGTLKANDQGLGMLAYSIKKETTFEAIGVTLEPDANGTQPRGKKVLGS